MGEKSTLVDFFSIECRKEKCKLVTEKLKLVTLVPILRSVLNFFQDLIQPTILRVLTPVWSEFDILSGVESGVENLRCQHLDFYY